MAVSRRNGFTETVVDLRDDFKVVEKVTFNRL
jgi:hypothetical protein